MSANGYAVITRKEKIKLKMTLNSEWNDRKKLQIMSGADLGPKFVALIVLHGVAHYKNPWSAPEYKLVQNEMA